MPTDELSAAASGSSRSWLSVAGVGSVLVAVITAAMSWVFSQNAITTAQDGQIAALAQRLTRVEVDEHAIRDERQAFQFRVADRFFEFNERVARLEGRLEPAGRADRDHSSEP